uniref:WSC domain-containing protein n=1 Tax=Pseudictyota dubia TaxID=2749911 RepID=A0A7R9ZDD0_9STRA|mmetsp:Transcript_44056/g.81876  ORF Transcript_44056/g.81876 Transcript_44056/m.81876 type:complete len:225 (+) Transcript_44056:76-750(+)
MIRALSTAYGCWLLFSVQIVSARWVRLDGHSCYDSCRNRGEDPVVSGQHHNGQKFNVCAVNPGGGYRAGYNLSNNHCTVGYGGRERGLPGAYCLCKPSDFYWRTAAPGDGNRCTETCSSPKLTSYFHGAPMSICATNYRDGYRGGYNVHDWGCTAGFGGKERATNSFRCLCTRSRRLGQAPDAEFDLPLGDSIALAEEEEFAIEHEEDGGPVGVGVTEEETVMA